MYVERLVLIRPVRLGRKPTALLSVAFAGPILFLIIEQRLLLSPVALLVSSTDFMQELVESYVGLDFVDLPLKFFLRDIG